MNRPAVAIRANCICPGFIDTPMLGRVLALYLAGDEAAYVTGVPFVVDGGSIAG